MRTDIGLYIHVPFCVRKCNYCDFASVSADSALKEKYIYHLCSEIQSYRCEKPRINSIFFGGGTPSLLSPKDIYLLRKSIDDAFITDGNTEFTVEVNPGALSEESLLAFLDCGANRFSIGLQSIHENEMKILGRIHNYEDFLSTYKLLRRDRVNNVSVDLMFGIPEQTVQSFEKTLSEIIKIAPEHLSAYGLILEEGTPLYKAKSSLNLPTEDEERQMYLRACEMLASADYRHYEISNFSRKGYSCKHNLKYWKDEEYIGVGLSAHSYYKGVRYGNSRRFDEYFANKGRELNELTDEDVKFEYTMLALRLSEGISLSDYENRFRENFLSGKEKNISTLKGHGLIRLEGDRLFLTEKGFWVSNSVITELLS